MVARADTVRILLVEDNPGDVLLTREALKEWHIAVHLTVAENGEQALAILRHEGANARATVPDLVLLDLNLPRLDGREVLARLKKDDELRHIPVIMFTSSHNPGDVIDCYRLHANCYLTKPSDFLEFVATLKAVESFWLTFARLPARAYAP